MHLKDLNNIIAESDSLQLELPLSQMMKQRFKRMVDELGLAKKDHSALYLELLERNGLGGKA